MAVPNTNNIATATLELVRPVMADNVFKANPTSAWFLSNGRVKTASGGEYIAETLLYSTNGTVQSYKGYERLNVAPTEELTQAQYNWRQGSASVSISGEEKLKNAAGPTQIHDLVKAKLKVADLSLKQFFCEKLHAATENKDTTRDILGLDEMIDSDTTWATLGGIDSSAESWWRNQLGPNGDGSGVFLGGTGAGTDTSPVEIATSDNATLSNLMARMCNNVAKGSADRPDLIITAQGVFERIERDAFDKLRLNSNDQNMTDLGFENFRYKGATVMWDENVRGTGTADQHPIYFITSKYMSFTLHKDRNFVTSDFKMPWDQDAQTAQMLFAGNMTCSNRRRLGVCWVDLSP